MSESIEWKVDRTGWPAGPWDGEPDRVEWRAHGLPCLAVRNHLGAWCGYAGVPPGHPVHGKAFRDVSVQAHRGANYSFGCDPPVCHTPQPGEPDDVWWFGFDCGHSRDLIPGMERPQILAIVGDTFRQLGGGYQTYRDLPYVKAQTEDLARQLAEMD